MFKKAPRQDLGGDIGPPPEYRERVDAQMRRTVEKAKQTAPAVFPDGGSVASRLDGLADLAGYVFDLQIHGNYAAGEFNSWKTWGTIFMLVMMIQNADQPSAETDTADDGQKEAIILMVAASLGKVPGYEQWGPYLSETVIQLMGYKQK